MTEVTSPTEASPAANQALFLCLSDIEGFESVNVRMPTPQECGNLGITANVPVLVMQRHGHEQLYRADLVTLTIDSAPPPAAWDVYDAVRYVLDCILDDLGNVLADVTRLDAAMAGPARSLVKLADEVRRG